MGLFQNNLKLTQNPLQKDDGSLGGNLLSAVGQGLGGGILGGGLFGGGVLPNVLKALGSHFGAKNSDDDDDDDYSMTTA